jgi:hypothetical protein
VRREIKFWIFIYIYILIIFLTIPFAPFLIQFIRNIVGEKNYGYFVSAVIFLFLFLIFRFSQFQSLTLRGKFWLLFLTFSGILIVLFMEIPAERIHFLEYGFLGFLLVKAFESGNPNSNTKYFLALISGAILGLSDELFQGVLQVQNIFPHIRRYFEWRDVFMNAFGVFLGVVFYFYVWKGGRKDK